jgi:hypothetical protein
MSLKLGTTGLKSSATTTTTETTAATSSVSLTFTDKYVYDFDAMVAELRSNADSPLSAEVTSETEINAKIEELAAKDILTDYNIAFTNDDYKTQVSKVLNFKRIYEQYFKQYYAIYKAELAANKTNGSISADSIAETIEATRSDVKKYLTNSSLLSATQAETIAKVAAIWSEGTGSISTLEESTIAKLTAALDTINSSIASVESAAAAAVSSEKTARIQADAETIITAEAYSDANLASSKSYTDASASASLVTAKKYVDQQDESYATTAKSNLDAEASLARANENDIKVDVLVNAAAIKSISSDITSEATNRANADNSLRTELKAYTDTSETNSRAYADSQDTILKKDLSDDISIKRQELLTDISTEAKTRETNDNAIWTHMNALSASQIYANNYTTDESGNVVEDYLLYSSENVQQTINKISSILERIDTTAADTISALTAETTARDSADKTEAAARKAKDDSLQSSLESEASTARAAEQTNAANISANASNISKNASNIATETNSRVSADNALGVRIDNEQTARANKDTDLENKINSLTAADIAVSNSGSNYLPTDSDKSKSNVQTSILALDTQLKAVADKAAIAYTYRGKVSTYAALLALTGMSVGDVYVVETVENDGSSSDGVSGTTATNVDYVWNGSSWDDLGHDVQLATTTNDGLMSKDFVNELITTDSRSQSNASRATSLETRVTKNESDISTNRTDIANEISRAKAAEKVNADNIASNDSDIANLQSSKQNNLTFDATPTKDSANPVTSGGLEKYVPIDLADFGGTQTGYDTRSDGTIYNYYYKIGLHLVNAENAKIGNDLTFTFNRATDTSVGIVAVDKAMSDASYNPVQNSVVKAYVDAAKAAAISSALTTTHAWSGLFQYATRSDFPKNDQGVDAGDIHYIYVDLSKSDAYYWSHTDSTYKHLDLTAFAHSQITDGTNPHNTTFANLASKPTTVSGFGITDAYTKTEIDTKVTALNKADSDESAARLSRDNALQSSIDANASAISTESARALAAEKQTNSNVSSNATQISSIQTNLANHISDQNTTNNTFASEIATNVSAISDETTRAKGVESSISSRIDNLSAVNVAASNTGSHYIASDTNVQSSLTQLDSDVYALSQSASKIFNYKGSVDYASGLPTGATLGDVYNVKYLSDKDESGNPVESNVDYVWNGTAWDSLGSTVGLASTTQDGLMTKKMVSRLGDVENVASTNSAKIANEITRATDAEATKLPINGGTMKGSITMTASHGYDYDASVFVKWSEMNNFAPEIGYDTLLAGGTAFVISINGDTDHAKGLAFMSDGGLYWKSSRVLTTLDLNANEIAIPSTLSLNYIAAPFNVENAIKSLDTEAKTLEGSITTSMNSAIDSAKGYADSKAASLTTAYETYADTKKSEAISSANSYTDTASATTKTNYEAYANARVVLVSSYSELASMSSPDSNAVYITKDTWNAYRYYTTDSTFKIIGKTAYDHSQITDGTNPHKTTFANIASKPTTVAGFGITDAYTKTETDSNVATAKASAISTAASDATSKANAAKSGAETDIKNLVGSAATANSSGSWGIAPLGTDAKVPQAYLPSYVDDVIEGYLSENKFYSDSSHTAEVSGETGKIYVDLNTSKTYRWSGSTFAVISETLALGETSSTAYAGDKGAANATAIANLQTAVSGKQKTLVFDTSFISGNADHVVSSDTLYNLVGVKITLGSASYGSSTVSWPINLVNTANANLSSATLSLSQATASSLGVVYVDAVMSTTSTNPVQNKVAKAYADNINTAIQGQIGSTTHTDANSNVIKGIAQLSSSGKLVDEEVPTDFSKTYWVDAYADLPAGGSGTDRLYIAGKGLYRYTGTSYVPLAPELGELSTNAYYGDKGKIAYDHSQTTSGNPHKVTFSDVYTASSAAAPTTLSGYHISDAYTKALSDSTFLAKVGGEMTGAITIAAGDGKGIVFKDTTSDINIGSQTIFGFVSNATVSSSYKSLTVNDWGYPLVFRGALDHPYYSANGSQASYTEIPLKSDIDNMIVDLT